MNFKIISLFPEVIHHYLSSGVIGKAASKGVFSYEVINPRDFATGVHKAVDDRPFGGGDGMVMTWSPLREAIEFALANSLTNKCKSRLIYLSPQGRLWNQEMVKEFHKCSIGAPDRASIDMQIESGLDSEAVMILISGRYAGIDQRFFSHYQIEEISIGDYVLSGGELPALVLLESLVRTLPGALGNADSAPSDSLWQGWLEAPQFTRPASAEAAPGATSAPRSGVVSGALPGPVPAVLLEGNHREIAEFRDLVAKIITHKKRPDLARPLLARMSVEDVRQVTQALQKWSEPARLCNLQLCGLAVTDVQNFQVELCSLQSRSAGDSKSVSPTAHPRVAIALLHYPILDRLQNIVSTNITNFDIHDIARAAKTYGVDAYYLIHPMRDQLMFVERVLDHWRVGSGADFNPSRKVALEPVKTAASLESALQAWTQTLPAGSSPRVVATHARTIPGAHQLKSFAEIREELASGVPIFIVFGTGSGLSDEMMLRCDSILEPIRGAPPQDFRHLSVRSAVSIILDRLLGA